MGGREREREERERECESRRHSSSPSPFFSPFRTFVTAPDVERNRHQRVEDDDVGPEGEEGREGGAGILVAREEDREHRALPHLPDGVADSQNGAH